MRFSRFLVIVFLVVIVGAGGLAIWNAGHQSESTSTRPVEQEGRDRRMLGKQVSFTVTEGTAKKWKLNAAKALYNDTQTDAELSDIDGDFFNPAGKPIMHFTAPKGHYSQKKNEVSLSGGVLLKTLQEEGGLLKAPAMHWDNKSREVLAGGGVELHQGKSVSTADQCYFDLNFTKITLQGNVTTRGVSPE